MIKFRTNSTHLFLVILIVVKKVLIVLRVRSCPILTFSYTDTMIVILLLLLHCTTVLLLVLVLLQVTVPLPVMVLNCYTYRYTRKKSYHLIYHQFKFNLTVTLCVVFHTDLGVHFINNNIMQPMAMVTGAF